MTNEIAHPEIEDGQQIPMPIIHREYNMGAPGFSRHVVGACDGNCAKAWGIQGRPRVHLGNHIDDHVHLPDSKLNIAPGPGETDCISEGFNVKPSATFMRDGKQLNKWCIRQCERLSEAETLEKAIAVMPNMERPDPNIPREGYVFDMTDEQIAEYFDHPDRKDQRHHLSLPIQQLIRERHRR